jgi:hypothetical protein
MPHFMERPSSALDLQFESSVNDLTVNDGNSMKPRVCVVCDCFLESHESNTISLDALKGMRNHFQGPPGVPPELHKYYTAPLCNKLRKLLLSPRGTFCVCTKSFLGCNDCVSSIKRQELPKFAIANDKTIGEAPPCLATLNPVELALISKSRVDKHIFQYYGGAHKSIKGWHTFYQNDVNQFSAVLNRPEVATTGNSIATILVGPFTSGQKSKIKERSLVRRMIVRQALSWLSANNIFYVDIDIDAQISNEVICIDKSGSDCESECPSVELKYEYTGKHQIMCTLH